MLVSYAGNDHLNEATQCRASVRASIGSTEQTSHYDAKKWTKSNRPGRSYGVCVLEYVCCGHTGSFRFILISHSFCYLFWLFFHSSLVRSRLLLIFYWILLLILYSFIPRLFTIIQVISSSVAFFLSLSLALTLTLYFSLPTFKLHFILHLINPLSS